MLRSINFGVFTSSVLLSRPRLVFTVVVVYCIAFRVPFRLLCRATNAVVRRARLYSGCNDRPARRHADHRLTVVSLFCTSPTITDRCPAPYGYRKYFIVRA
uniref:Uncharacterized protein n=1 Tax=Sipha flava TaxID=143950 RepID=A0A2S2QC45_9HEMI